MESDLGILGVEYTEFVKNSYRGFTATWGKDDECILFDGGGVERDFVEAFNHLVEVGCSSIICSSSVDNFLHDDGGYEWTEEDEGEGQRIVKKPLLP